MAVSPSVVDALLAQTDLVALIGKEVRLKRSGASYLGLCPFHQDKHPSLHVSPQKQIYKCFSCGAGGNALKFLQAFHQQSFPEALETLSRVTGIPLEIASPEETQARARRERLLAASRRAAELYREALLSHPSAMEGARGYLSARGLEASTLALYGVGFAPEASHFLREHFPASEFSLLEEAGLLVKGHSGLSERFRGRILFPVQDAQGVVVGFGGRALGNREPKYLNSPESPLFRKRELLYGLDLAIKSRKRQVFVVEGYTDVLACYQSSVPNVVATLGTALTELHLQRLFRHFDELFFCFDGDEAGQRAAAKALELTLKHLHDGQNAYFVTLPQGRDPGDYMALGEPHKLREALSNSEEISTYLFSHAPLPSNPTAGQRSAWIQKLRPLVESMPPSVYQDLLRAELYERVGLPLPFAREDSRESPAKKKEPPPQRGLLKTHPLLSQTSRSYDLLSALLLRAPEAFSPSDLEHTESALSSLSSPFGSKESLEFLRALLSAMRRLAGEDAGVTLGLLYSRMEAHSERFLSLLSEQDDADEAPVLRCYAHLSEMTYEHELSLWRANHTEEARADAPTLVEGLSLAGRSATLFETFLLQKKGELGDSGAALFSRYLAALKDQMTLNSKGYAPSSHAFLLALQAQNPSS